MKKITLLLLFAICVVGFSRAQTEPESGGTATSKDLQSTTRNMDATDLDSRKSTAIVPKKTVQKGAVKDLLSLGLERNAVLTPKKTVQQGELIDVLSLGTDRNATFNSKKATSYKAPLNKPFVAALIEQTPDNEAEILADKNWRATQPQSISRAPNSLSVRSPMADIIPTAGATETFVVAVGDNFFDPGGPGGSSTGGTPGNYPNCGCVTTTTLDGATEIEFLFFSVFATFDWLKIYDGPDTSGPVLFNNATGGGNQGDITLADMIASNGSASFTGASGSLTFEFNATAVVDYGGWDVEIIAAGGGGGSLMLPITFEGQTVSFSDFNGSATQVIANPDASGVNTSANVAENVVPANAAFAGVNIVVPVDLTDDKMFSMNVWSPLADTPVLLKLEGGPNPPVERQANLTTTGAWEEVVFDFSSEGAITFDSVTIFMNFNMTDPANQTFYWDNLVQMNSGGGGGMACNEENPSNGFENGIFSGTGPLAPEQVVATDITIPADTDFSLTAVNANLGIRGFGETITSSEIIIYGDTGGFPDPANVIASFPAVVPTSQSILGTAFTDYEVLDVDFDIPATMLAGQAGATTTYWISIYSTASNADDVFWEATTATINGNEGVFSVDNAASWAGYLGGGTDMVYDFSGECTPIGGGGMACNEENPSNGFENGIFSGTGPLAPEQVVATDITIPADTDFSLTAVNANLGIRGFGETITSAEIIIYGDIGAFPDPANVIASFPAVVPTSQSILGTAFTDYEVLDVDFDIPATMLTGQAGATTTYWISIYSTASNADDVFWEATTATINGNEGVFSVDNAATWAGYLGGGTDMVYDFSGECTPIGGGGGPCTPGSITTLYDGGNGGNQGGAVYFDITVGPTDIDVESLDMNTADPGAFTMDVYVFEGTYAGNEADPAPWGTPVAQGSGTGAGVGVPSTATLDVPITMSAGTTYAVALVFDATHAHTYTNGDGTNQNYSNADITLDLGSGSNVPFVGPTFNPRVWNGGVGYCVDNGVPPDNDTCEDAIAVVCGDIIVGDTLTNTDTGGNPAPDEWYEFTGTGSAEIVTISLCDGGTDYDSLLRVFSDCTLANEIATNDDFCGLQSELSFASDGTSTYYIMVEGFGANAGNFSMAVTCIAAPDNDNCGGALPIGCGDIVAGSTVNASVDSAVAPTCDTTVTAPGVWYVYEDTTGLITDITITMCNGTTDYDSKLSVYTGDCGAPPLNCVVGNDDTCGLQSEVSFQSDGFTTFYILVHGFGGATGNFEIEMTCTPIPPPNDMIANSIDVDEIGFPYTDPSVAMPAATVEAGSPVNCDNSGARGVWYNFVPEGDGTATASITTPGGGLLFTVNNGPLAGSYQAVAAGFGAEFTTMLVTEDTAIVLDDDTTGDPNDACDPILNGADLAGKIAIVRRGACEFGGKALAAQNEGAIAVIVVNNQPGDPIVMGGGVSGGDVTIPVLMVTDVDGEAIIAELSGASVNVSMGLAPAGFSSVTFYTAPNENAVETDLVLVDWFENQCLPGSTASIPTVAGQAYYVYVANHSAITDIVIDGTNLGTVDNTIEGFVYYPNPAESILTLSAQDTIERVAIYNMLGQKVVEQNVNAIRSEVNVSELATGAYLMRVSVNGQIGTYKILKK